MAPFHRRNLLICGLMAAAVACTEASAPGEPSLQQELQQVLDSSLALCDGFGATAAVLMPGEDIWMATSGVSHDTVAVTPEMIFGIASTTKAFVAAVVFMLAEDGLLSLKDSLHRWLPAYPHVDSTITIRQLLGHTSGVYNYDSHPDFWDSMRSDLSRVWLPGELLVTFMREPYFAPGTDFSYANTNYILLGLIIEAATGTPPAAVLRSRILDPLGLDHTFLMIDEDATGVLVHPWWDMDGDGVIDDLSAVPAEAFYSMGWTAGAMASTAEELVTFSRALFEGDLLSPASLSQMLDFHPVGNYGLGLHLWELPADTTIVGHRGENPLSDVTMAYAPDHGVHFAVILNWRSYECNAAISAALIRTAIN